jgi:eukaryotic-like serine/threonine-protein kinase
VFSSQRLNNGAPSLFSQSADGTGTAERLTQNPSWTFQATSAVSPDGTRAVFTQGGAATTSDVMSLTLDKDHLVQPVVQTQFAELNGEISPDGRWLAYQSNDSGQVQIFVVPFPAVKNGRWQVSTGGGTRPLWARNGQELFYLAPDSTLMSVPVARGTTWTPATPVTLIKAPYYGGATRNYDVSPDGKRFLMIKQGGGDQPPAPTSIVVVQNWQQELKRLAPTAR